MRKNDFWITILATVFLMAACQDRNQTAVGPSSGPSPIVSATVTSSPLPAPTTTPAAANNATDKWLGRWKGVEGTYLNLSKDPQSMGKYVVKIANLDGPKTYEGVAVGDHIEFKRNGKTESIRAVNGKETGMKWLMSEQNCLVVTFGSEGFCRKEMK